MSLLTLLAGCAATSEPATQTKVVYEAPPAALFPECEEPVVSFGTNDDLARAYMRVRSALDECRQGVADLREWADNHGSKQ